MNKLITLVAILIFATVIYILTVVLWGSSNSIKFKKHAAAHPESIAFKA